ncbi:glycosyltransferase family 4 protein [Ilumatobacter sp.]|uniref:glycosyltransferase family 4 protein n=1 Tax=Ilumatobacter sp. TaxID=1967498 RepID=UPI003B51D037
MTAGADPVRVAYAVEQCWHDAPGGTAVAAVEIGRELRSRCDVDVRFVAGKHPRPPEATFAPPGPVAMLPLARPLLYETWTRLRWPKVESVTGPVDVAHATGLVPCASSAPLVVTVHDVAFLHDPGKFTRHGVALMTRSLAVARERAARVVCSSRATHDDLLEHGFDPDVVRVVPLGVDPVVATASERADARRRHDLPDEYVLFVGTLEPRKNLPRLLDAMRRLAASGTALPLVVVGANGWGDVRAGLGDAAGGVGPGTVDVRFTGFVDAADLRGIYACATVFAYPSEREGFGLPVAEAMARSTPVVTSRATSTEEVAGGAAVLVDPFDVDDIARGIAEALGRSDELVAAGRARAAELTWERSAVATLDVYRELRR